MPRWRLWQIWGPAEMVGVACCWGCGQVVSHSYSTDDLDLELRLARFEELMDRRPFLLSR